MPNATRACLLTGVLLLGALGVASAQDKKPVEDDDVTAMDEASYLVALAKIVNESSFVWVTPKTTVANRRRIQSFADRFEAKFYSNLDGFPVPLSADETLAQLAELVADDASFEDQGETPQYVVEPNAYVYGFQADCGNETGLPATQEKPWGVEFVGGPAKGFTQKVWVIDSGISADFDNTELKVNRTESIRCERPTLGGGMSLAAPTCAPDPASSDRLGHGTAIAGIIGAFDDADGLVGVAPDVELVPVQIFTRRRPIVDLGIAYQALNHVTGVAKSGEVVNLSWGSRWDPRKNSEELQIEGLLRDLAAAGVRVSIAAGNIESLENSGYVETISPSRAGGRGLQASNGAVVTVSAFGRNPVDGNWTFSFWPGSAFGNGAIDTNATPMDKTDDFQIGPPDFAEPGVSVKTLVPGGKVANCTGTSFAAAHMSGILAKGFPKAFGAVERDPSAENPEAPGNYDPSRQDRIGIVP